MTNTLHLGLPFIEGSQAQKHVTHNEALRILDAIVQIGVLDADRTAPPSSPTEGDRHIVASGATGAWVGQAKTIALHEDGGWRFLAPRAGWCAWSAADGVLLVYDGAAWNEVAGGGGGGTGDSVAKLGVNDTATAPNLLTVRSSDALFHAVAAADGGSGDVRLQIAKEGAANTASVFFSDAYAGHAEFGLTGDNDFHLKVSADGTTWRDAVTFDRTTGRASFPGGGVREILAANRTYYVRTDGSDTNNGLVNSAGSAFATIQKALHVAAGLDLGICNVTIRVADGTYTGGMTIAGPWVGSGSVAVVGNTTTPANVVISSTGDCVEVTGGGAITVSGMRLTSSGGNSLYAVGGGSRIAVGAGVIFGSVAQYHMRADNGGWITARNAYTISGGGPQHMLAITGGIIEVSGITVTLTGTPAFSAQFANALSGGQISLWAVTYSGAATGIRYSATGNGVINTFGQLTSYLPGNAAGSTATGGQYL
jgi:hypothetical protein